MADQKESKAVATPKAEKLRSVTVRTNPERVKSKHAQFVELQDGTYVRIGRDPVKVLKTDFVNQLLLAGSLTED